MHTDFLALLRCPCCGSQHSLELADARGDASRRLVRVRVLSLPYEDGGYWWAQQRGVERLLETTPFAPGPSILDIGSNTCWAAATFAAHGLRAIARSLSQGPRAAFVATCRTPARLGFASQLRDSINGLDT